MIEFADLKLFNLELIDHEFAMFFLAYYISNGAYYMDDFHFNYELQRMKFNSFGGGDTNGNMLSTMLQSLTGGGGTNNSTSNDTNNIDEDGFRNPSKRRRFR